MTTSSRCLLYDDVLYFPDRDITRLCISQHVRTVDNMPTNTPNTNTPIVKPAVAPGVKLLSSSLLLLLFLLLSHVAVGLGIYEETVAMVLALTTEATESLEGGITVTPAGVGVETVIVETVIIETATGVVIIIVVMLGCTVYVTLGCTVYVTLGCTVLVTLGCTVYVMLGCILLGQELGGTLIDGTIFTSPSVMVTSPASTFFVNNDTTWSRGTAVL